MSSRHLRSAIGAALALCVMGISAGEKKPDLMDIYNLALKNDAQLAAARATLKAEEERVPQGLALLLPNIGLTANTRKNDVKQQVDRGKDIRQEYNSHNWGASLRQPVFNFANWFSYQQAETLSAKAQADFAVEQQNLILRVAEAYFNVLRAEDNLTSLKAEEEAYKGQLDRSQQRYNVGLIAITDVHESKAVYDTSRANRIKADSDLKNSFESLRVITAEYIDVIAQMNKEMPVSPPVPAVMEKWVEQAVVENLNVRSARESVSSALQQLKVSKSGHAPTLDAVVSYTDQKDGSQAGSRVDAGGVMSGRGKSTVYGLELSLPLFSGGATTSKTRESEYRLKTAEEQLDYQLRSVSASTRNQYRLVLSDIDRVDALCQGIVSSESALQATQSGYEVGTRNIIDVLDSQRKLYAAQRDYLTARYDYIIDTLKLKQAAGTLSPQDLVDLNKWLSQKAHSLLTPRCSVRQG
ncbi:TolC family outer membrane protein [Spongorhabdus nitratireducens]